MDFCPPLDLTCFSFPVTPERSCSSLEEISVKDQKELGKLCKKCPQIPRAEFAQEHCSITSTETLQDRNVATRRGEYTQHRAIPSTARTGSRTPWCQSKPQP